VRIGVTETVGVQIGGLSAAAAVGEGAAATRESGGAVAFTRHRESVAHVKSVEK